VAQYLLQSLSAVKQWVRHYKDEGIDDLKEKQRSGRPSKARDFFKPCPSRAKAGVKKSPSG
jgi:transposase